MTLRKVGAIMMNENVKRAYEDLVKARNTLACVAETDENSINECMGLLFTGTVSLRKEETYEVFAKSLQQHIYSYFNKKVDKNFILEYTSQLIEMIEDGNKPAYSEEIKQMCDEARTAFEEVTSMVQESLYATKEIVKEEGPKQAAKVEKKAKQVARKLVDGFHKWLNEDENQEEEPEDKDE